MNLNWLRDNTIFLTLHGSQAYGLSNELSDTDVKGICIPPRHIESDLFQRFEQAENDKSVEEKYASWKNPKNPKFESVIYSLRKFFLLASNVNPNIIELLWTDPSTWLEYSEWSARLHERRSMFLSTKAKFTFSGYAMAQAKKIERHRKWIVQGELAPPKREDFGLPPIMSRGVEEIFGYIKAKVEQWNFNQFPLEESSRSDLKELIWELLYELSSKSVSWDNWPDAYAAAAIHKMETELDLREEVISLINAERAYFKAKKNYESWLRWKAERNPARRALEVKCGYDCYSGDTEFLTEDGWKLFDDILPETKLATVNPKSFQVEYHKYIEKFDSKFNGNLYNFQGTHTDILVTPNHKMWVQLRERNTKKVHSWQFIEASHLPGGFDILRCIRPLKREWKKKILPPQKYERLKNVCRSNILKLIGWWVSEGCVLRKNGLTKGISISQLKGGRIHNHIAKCCGMDSKLKEVLHEYAYFRKKRSRWEITWNIYDRDIGEWFENNCGKYAKDKRLPRWIMLLSTREKIMVLDAMMNGDGTNRAKDNSEIYYTCSKQLANDVHELAFLCGFETSLWGPYNGMFQVHINRTRTLTKQMTGPKSIKITPVIQHRIVCFTVPNHLLVTRRNGKIAIQGNSKHASHLVRLMRMGYEIMSIGKVIVYRPDAEELLSIKNGEWSYEKVMEETERMQKQLDELYNSIEADRKAGKPVILPKEVNFAELNKFYHQLSEEYLSR